MKIPSKWICLQERSPSPHEEVLVFFKQDKKAIIMKSKMDANKEWDLGSISDLNVDPSPLVATHWMPLFT